jgi:adenylate cyclase
MDRATASDILLFEGFRFDYGGLFQFDRVGSIAPIALGSRALDVLALLVERPGELISRDKIMEAVWPGTTVEEGNLTVQISTLRRILDRNRPHGSCIQTVPGRGYRFVAPVSRGDPSSAVPIVRQGSVTARPRMSIVVLPFANLSDDREQQYFADGLTDDLTTDLSRVAGMLVISCNTAFTFRNKQIDTKQIGRELGVRYVLEGSVRRSGCQLRVNAQLIDAETDAHLWAERFDRGTGDLFALQNEITGRIAVALNLELIVAAAARRTEHPDALDYILRGRAVNFRAPSRDKYAEALIQFERALAIDPQSAEALSWLATTLTARVLDQMADAAAADIARAEGLVEQALAASPRNPQAHFAKGNVLRARNRYEEAIPEYETAIACNCNWVSAIHALGQCKFYTGSIEETIPLEEQAIRLSPRDPYIGNWYCRIGMVHLLQSRIDEAMLWLEKARNANPEHPPTRAAAASCYALKGETERAAAELAEAGRLSTDDRYSSIARLKAVGHFGVAKIRVMHEATYLTGLRKAGMPE